MSGVMPQTVGSNPVGICAPTVRDSFDLARHPNLGARLADHLPVGAVGHRPDHRVLRVEFDERPRIGLADDTTKEKSLSRNTDTSSGAE